jgi:flagellar biosynthesis protein FliQ
MAESDVAALVREAMVVMLKVGGPPLLAGLAVGLVVSLVQAITQINESALAFVPKALALCAALVLLGPFMLATLSDYTRQLFDKLVAIGGS